MNNIITRNQLNGYKVVAIPYCGMQALLQRTESSGYNAGIYGWNYTVYIFDAVGIAITTGYRPIGKKAPKWIYEEEEKKARIIVDPVERELLLFAVIWKILNWFKEEKIK